MGNLGGPPESFLNTAIQSERKVQQKYKKKSETLFTSGQDKKFVNLCPPSTKNIFGNLLASLIGLYREQNGFVIG